MKFIKVLFKPYRYYYYRVYNFHLNPFLFTNKDYASIRAFYIITLALSANLIYIFIKFHDQTIQPVLMAILSLTLFVAIFFLPWTDEKKLKKEFAEVSSKTNKIADTAIVIYLLTTIILLISLSGRIK